MPDSKLTNTNTHKCGYNSCTHDATKHCGECKQVWYCSRECQRADWQGIHKRMCPGLASGLLTHDFKRSPKLDSKQRDFLSKHYAIDISVQNLIPGNTSHDWSVPKTLAIAHRPYSMLCQFLPGRSIGYVEIYPSGYDYDLTHTLYYVPESNPARTVPTSELTIEGVELVGVQQLDKQAMATFLEAVVGRAKSSPTAYIVSIGEHNIDQFIEPQMNNENHHYMYRGLDRLNGKERREHETLQALRRNGLRLTSPSGDWMRKLGMDWTEYFFGVVEVTEGKELNYGTGPKFDMARGDYSSACHIG
ncbi:hypothetical protein BDZ91DRAFT_729647 [Kalaharituber pfeilii]|nr:hypothetical protein BDZ91DRAFT_729647 [Kalaharituber pfeilii]